LLIKKGTETVLLERSHVLLRRENTPDLLFHKAYSYGKSTKYQRIEAWWNILTEGQTQEWQVFFAELEEQGLFDGGDIDESCLQYIYMDIIRSHIHQFVAIHNSHSIRRQRLGSHYLPTGQPYLLYYYPDSVRNYKTPVNADRLAEMEAEVKDFDLDQYLPTETLKLYAELLSAGGYPAEYVYSDTRHRSAYVFLCERAAAYILDGGEINLFNSPTGAEECIRAHNTAEIEDHRAFDYSMVIDETDDDGYDVVGSTQMKSSGIQADRNSGNSGESSIHDEINTIWDSSENKEYGDETNDGYFLDL